MKEKKKYEDSLLRQKAEAILKPTHEKYSFDAKEKDQSKLYYELEVHQIELQMQNEELIHAKSEAQDLSKKYVQLYDFAPTAYFTVSHSGQIVELNLSGAKMLGKDRSHLINSNFGFHISKDTRSTYNHFFDNLYSSGTKQECEVCLELKDSLISYLHLIGQVDDAANNCFINAVDITERMKLMSLNETLLNSLPYPAMYIRYKDRAILGANSNATKLGFKVGGLCWRRFDELDSISAENMDVQSEFTTLVPGECDVKCSFCLADKCMLDEKEQSFSQLHAFGFIWDVHWIKVSKEVYLHYFIDITNRVEYEKALHCSELFLKQTQQIAMLGSYSLDIVSGEWLGSEIMDEIFGIDKDHPKNIDSWLSLIHPEWKKDMHGYFMEEVVAKKQKFDKEYKIIRPSDGQVRWVHGLGELIFNEQQQPIKMIGTIQDISTSKKLELERNYLLASVENVPNRIVVKDLDLKVVSANKSWIQSKGELSIENLIGKTDAEVFGISPDAEPVRTYMEQDRKVLGLAPGEFIESEWPVKLFNGEDTIASLRRYPIFDDRGKLFCIGCIAIDITELKKNEALITNLNETLERKVQLRTKQLEDANKELEAFSYSVSHDLRAPLRHINGFSEMLSKDTQEQLSEKGRHYLEVISESARNMGLLIDDLLDFSRTGRMEMKKISFLMKEVIDEACQFLLPSYENRQISWEIAEMPKVFADYNLIRQVWINLLDNALKYARTRENTFIKIGSALLETEYLFSIQDNGVGFDSKYSEKLFGVFQRLHASSDFEGTGIGLANVRRIVLRHGGRTWAESELDKGATFYFTLPKTETIS